VDRAPFGRYVLRERMARGGMGEVFHALAIGAGGFEKPVVVKRVLPQLGSASVAEMFVEEARLMSRLAHPNIVQVIDFGQGEGDEYFLVMELVDGVDLGAFIDSFGSAMPVGLAAFIATQVLRGLGHAHDKAYPDGRTLVHRDISPGNVLLSSVGDVKVADFGVALVSRPDADDGPTTLAGKLGYMAPEQHAGHALDARADLFSVGVVLFHLLAGEVPFEGRDPAERQASANAGRVRSLAALRPEVSGDLEAVVKQALASKPEDRFASARAFSKAIQAACRTSGVALASHDELAEQVERVAASKRAPARPVLALSAGLVRELTRVEAGHKFTVRTLGEGRATLVDDSDDTAPPPAHTETSSAAPATPPERRSRWPAAVLAGTLALAGGAAYAVLGSTADDAGNHVAVLESFTRAARPPPAPSAVEVATSASSPARVTTRSLPTPLSSGRPAPEEPGCVGQVLLSGKGSWWVNGGPGGRVQAPGVYSWPCRSYALTGTSRVDGKVVARGVQVQQGATASARFE
jgi:serine/threonine protein kinase